MENKSNDATPNRPEGERPIDATLITMDLVQLMEQVKSEPGWQHNDRNSVTLFKSALMRIVLVGLHSGAELKTHTASGIISVQVVKGLMQFEAEGQVIEMAGGKMLALHENLPHSVKALEETFFLLTMAMAANIQIK